MNPDLKPSHATGKTEAVAEAIDLVGSRFELVARMGDSDGDTVLFRTRMAAGRLVPMHSHIDPECFYVLEGRIEVFLADDAIGWLSVAAGESLLVADGVRHAVRNTANEAADLIMATNNRFARFMAEGGRRVAPDAPNVPPGRRTFNVYSAHPKLLVIGTPRPPRAPLSPATVETRPRAPTSWRQARPTSPPASSPANRSRPALPS